jgi:hypothetical protein
MGHAAWVVAPLVLVGVLAFGAVPKLGQGATLRKIIHNLGLPLWVLPAALARAIPGLELALAVALLAPWVPVFFVASAATLVLMSAYWALIARGLTVTPRPACGCFGQAGDHRISGRTLVRNTLLVTAAGAALALAVSGQTVWSLLSAGSAGDRLWLALAALACVVTGLVLGGNGGPTREARGEEGDAATEPLGDEEGEDGEDYVRRPTPELVLHDPAAGRPVTLLELSHRRAQLLVFVNCYCVSTLEVLGRLEAWDARLSLVDVHLVLSVPVNDALAPYPGGTLVDHAGLVWAGLGLTASPSAVLLGADGFLAGGPLAGSQAVAEFVDDVEESLREASAGGEAVDILESTEGASASQGAPSPDAAGVADAAR